MYHLTRTTQPSSSNDEERNRPPAPQPRQEMAATIIDTDTALTHRSRPNGEAYPAISASMNAVEHQCNNDREDNDDPHPKNEEETARIATSRSTTRNIQHTKISMLANRLSSSWKKMKRLDRDEGEEIGEENNGVEEESRSHLPAKDPLLLLPNQENDDDDGLATVISRKTTGDEVESENKSVPDQPPPDTTITNQEDVANDDEKEVNDEHDDITVVAKLVNEDDIRDRIQRQLMEQAVAADMMDPTMEQQELEAERLRQERVMEEQLHQQKRTRRRFMFGGGVLLLIVVIIIIVVVVTTGSNSSSPVSSPTTGAPTLAPSTTTLRTTPPAAAPHFITSDLNPDSAQSSVFDVLAAGTNHTLMTQYVTDIPSLENFLINEQATLFAPADTSWNAFANASPSFARYINTSQSSSNNSSYWVGHLTFLLNYHTVVGKINLSELFITYGATTKDGLSLQASPTDDTIGDNAAIILTPDVPAFNGYLDVPDRVLINSSLNNTILDWIIDHATSLNLHNLAQVLQSTIEQLVDSSFLGLLRQSTEAGLTLLAPTDTAFAAANLTAANLIATANATTITNGGPNQTLVQELLGYHLLQTNLYAIPVTSTSPALVTTFNGYSLWISENDQNQTYFNGVPSAQQSSNYVQNGIVSLLDEILMPPNLGGLLQITNNVNANYQTTRFINVTDGPAQLTSLLHNDISLYHNNTSLTLFAPLDHVFDQNSFSMQVLDRFLETGWLLHLQNVIRHHFTDQTISSGAGPHTIQMLSGFNTSIRVQPDSNITVDDVPVEPVDTGPLHALNGWIHYLNGLLVPPWTNISILESIHKNSNLTFLASLVASTNLASLLNGTGPLTLFAPSNAAVAKLNASSLKTLSLPNLLLGHVLDGNWYGPSDISSNVSVLTTVSNHTLQIKNVGDQTYVDGILISEFNLLASNGVIHVIDGVFGIT